MIEAQKRIPLVTRRQFLSAAAMVFGFAAGMRNVLGQDQQTPEEAWRTKCEAAAEQQAIHLQKISQHLPALGADDAFKRQSTRTFIAEKLRALHKDMWPPTPSIQALLDETMRAAGNPALLEDAEINVVLRYLAAGLQEECAMKICIPPGTYSCREIVHALSQQTGLKIRFKTKIAEAMITIEAGKNTWHEALNLVLNATSTNIWPREVNELIVGQSSNAKTRCTEDGIFVQHNPIDEDPLLQVYAIPNMFVYAEGDLITSAFRPSSHDGPPKRDHPSIKPSRDKRWSLYRASQPMVSPPLPVATASIPFGEGWTIAVRRDVHTPDDEIAQGQGEECIEITFKCGNSQAPQIALSTLEILGHSVLSFYDEQGQVIPSFIASSSESCSHQSFVCRVQRPPHSWKVQYFRYIDKVSIPIPPEFLQQ